MADEMYLQKSVQYDGGVYVGADEEGNIYRGIVVFMIQGMKKSRPVVVKGCPEVKVCGKWLAEELSTCISLLAKAGFNVRAVVADNHSANVAAFKFLIAMYSGNHLYIKHPDNRANTHLFFDNVHLLKNIRNNLFNAQKFVFPSFSLHVGSTEITCEDGYIEWNDLKDIYAQDSRLAANLRKAPKLTYRALHPYNNKQNVNLALSIFHETTLAANMCYFPSRKDVSSFLTLINTWWTIVNCKQRFTPNNLGSAVIPGDRKVDFLISFGDWFAKWSDSKCGFCLSKQTFDALITTLYAQASLISDLLQEIFEFAIPAKSRSSIK